MILHVLITSRSLLVSHLESIIEFKTRLVKSTNFITRTSRTNYKTQQNVADIKKKNSISRTLLTNYKISWST